MVANVGAAEWVGACPVCGTLHIRGVPLWRGSWALAVAPRMAGHLWAAHPYEATVLLLCLERARGQAGAAERDP